MSLIKVSGSGGMWVSGGISVSRYLGIRGIRGIMGIKPRPNDRNMSTQHIATLLGATCCVRLATMLRCVATCWVLLAQV